MRAYVMVSRSKRLPEKHLIEIIPEKRLIDLVIENLKSLHFEVLVYSTYDIEVDAKVIKDNSTWILPSIVSLLKRDSEFFLFGGDMPLVRKEAIEIMREYMEGDKTLIPKWSKTGYLEPLHGFYTSSSLPCFVEEMRRKEKASLTHALKNCLSVKFVPAELMPEETFFNVNYPEDVWRLREILERMKK